MSRLKKMVAIANRKGHSQQGAWRIDKYRGGYEIRHYGTLILRLSKAGRPTYAGGYSKSDVDGINTVFRELNVPYYASGASGKRTIRQHVLRHGKPAIKSRSGIRIYKAGRR